MSSPSSPLEIEQYRQEHNSSPTSILSRDDMRLHTLGYKSSLPRTLNQLDNTLAAMETLYFIGGIQSLFSYALLSGGPMTTWINWIIVPLFMSCMAASLGEVCSAYPTAGSIYYWAYQCGGDKWGPFLSWITATLNVSGWILMTASDVLGGSNFISSIPIAYGVLDPVKEFHDTPRKLVLLASCVGILVIATLINAIDHTKLNFIVKIVAVMMLALYCMNVIWLPIAASSSYGLQSAKFAFTETYNPYNAGYYWLANMIYPMYALVGFDSAAHVAEETHESSINTPASLHKAVVFSSLLSLPIVYSLIFSIPSLQEMYKFYETYPQPVVGVYTKAFGLDASLAIILLSTLVYIANTSFAILSTSRLLFALARDRILPMSLAKVNRHGQPFVAIIATFVCVLFLILPEIFSMVVYRSVVASSIICTTASYTIVVAAKVIFWIDFSQAPWNLGKWSKTFSIIGMIWGVFIIICLGFPQTTDVEVESFNYSPFIFLLVLGTSLIAWVLYARKWFKGPKIQKHVDVSESVMGMVDRSNSQGIQLPSETLRGTSDSVLHDIQTPLPRIVIRAETQPAFLRNLTSNSSTIQ